MCDLLSYCVQLLVNATDHLHNARNAYQIRRCTSQVTLQMQISRPQSCDQTHRKIKAWRSVCVQYPTLYNRHLLQSDNSDTPQLVSNALPGRYSRFSLNNKVFWDCNGIKLTCSIYTTHHLPAVPNNITHGPHITYQQYQPIYHTVYTSPTSSSNQYTTPSTHNLHAALKLATPLHHVVTPHR
jgi:hypothetical protein